MSSDADVVTLLHTHTQAQVQMDAHACKCSRIQNKHTLGFGVLLSILSLSLSVSLGGSRCGHMTAAAAAAILCMWGCVSARVCTPSTVACLFMYNNACVF